MGDERFGKEKGENYQGITGKSALPQPDCLPAHPTIHYKILHNIYLCI
jgi:hypothetical protein